MYGGFEESVSDEWGMEPKLESITLEGTSDKRVIESTEISPFVDSENLEEGNTSLGEVLDIFPGTKLGAMNEPTKEFLLFLVYKSKAQQRNSCKK